MKFKALKRFIDLEDDNHIYNVGDEYPRKNHQVTDERLIALMTGTNKRHEVLVFPYSSGEMIGEVVSMPSEEKTAEIEENEPSKADKPKKKKKTVTDD